MKRLRLQYEQYRRNGYSRRESARLALRDVGIKTFRLAKSGGYHHEINNWNWKT